MSLLQQPFSASAAAVVPPSCNPQAGDTMDMLLAKLSHVLAGGSGCEVVANTTARTYGTLGFIVLTDVIFSALTASSGYTVTGCTGVTFAAGTTLPFRVDAFTLTSGSVLAIKD